MVCHQLSQQPDTYPLLPTILAASSIRIDNLFLLVLCLAPLWGPGPVSSPADGRCHRPDRGHHVIPFVQRSVAPGVKCRHRRRRRALILHSQEEMKLSESGVLLLQNEVHRVKASVQHSLVF